ncbi:cyclin [Yamadazyma tenuis]|uniref:Cyclin-like protein n=1 Tax=Candida tenuis (strain ATCC 10573 / BCRC 21748 / CBS 615 / JCM 9827 / NBRC 10315 / NRRL Y-1498 / VKM Y-70) TaxID=590646 RepID=G3AY42_CANTC|nr:cyclin-like protein [Yamadazyma tenuis ATCC 10573]EGV65764.1 cyclin-like protein [Yamadazyma tenuis ATCC 10573]WEJ95916.1 cyclin [Yamadazyma tenuis]
MPSISSIPKVTQLDYPKTLYNRELEVHRASLQEYNEDIFNAIAASVTANKPNLELYQQQPYLTNSIRVKLIDFLLKMSVRLKIIPFVFFRAVKIFDRYCSKRVMLLDQSQLIITTCLWIASKVQGGNNHFLNLSNLNKLTDIKTINDLGYGSGGKYLGPTERFRLPKLHELVKLCGAKCKYDQSMFRQMELHILQTLDWSFNDPSIEEFLVKSDELSIVNNNNNEFFYVKQYLSYVSLYSYELIDADLIDMSKVMADLVNEIFNLSEDNAYFQTINTPTFNDDNDDDFFIEDEHLVLTNRYLSKMDYSQYKHIKKHLIKAVLHSSEFVLNLFNSNGPLYLYKQIVMMYRDPYKVAAAVPVTPTTPTSPIQFPGVSPSLVTSVNNINYIYKPVPLSSSNTPLLKKYNPEYSHIPKINTSHQHTMSQVSINTASSVNTSISRDTDSHSIFDEHRRFGGYTPVSDEESPTCFGNFGNVQPQPHSQPYQPCSYKFA